jgi:hypothetical protein
MHGAKQTKAENAIKKSTFSLLKVRHARLSVEASPITNLLGARHNYSFFQLYQLYH